jgi:CRP-like cAMP-binding protein
MAALRRHPVFGGLSAGLLARLGAIAKSCTVRRGVTIFTKGDSGTALFVLVSGLVKVCVMSAGGRELVFSLAHRGDSFGEIAALGDLPRTADARAVTACEVLRLEHADLFALVREDPCFAVALTRVVCLRYQLVSARLEEALLLDFSQRLAKTLLWLNEKHAAGTGAPVIRITQAEIGRLLGGSRETTNRQLRSWQRSKWVRLHKAGIEILAPNALAGMVGADGVTAWCETRLVT